MNCKNEFEKFMDSHKTNKDKDFTNLSFKGGKYYIQQTEYEEFLDLYEKYDGSSYGIVEKMNYKYDYMRFDLDFKFKDITKIKKKDITNICNIIKMKINEFCDINYDMYILLRNKAVFKDGLYKYGIHIQIPDIIPEKKTLMKLIRIELIKDNTLIKLFQDMKIINKIDDIIDESVYISNGWMLYGSDKSCDNSNSYNLKYIFDNDSKMIKYNPENNKINLIKLFSIRNKIVNNMIPLEINEIKIEKINQIENNDKEIELNKLRIEKENKEKKNNIKWNNVIDKDFIKELVYILNSKRAINYKTWSELGWCLKSIDENTFKLFDAFSKLCEDKYNEDNVEKFWNDSTQGNYTMGTLRYWAKQDNPEKYDEICEKYKKYDMSNTLPFEWDDDSVGLDFSKRYFDKFIYQNKIMYFFNGVYWEEDDELLYIKSFISNTYKTELRNINIKIRNYKLSKTNDPGVMKDIEKSYEIKDACISSITKSNSKKNITDCTKLYFTNNDIEFDTKPYLFCFKNKVWDLTKGEFIKPNPFDYLSVTTGYKYDEDEELENKLIQMDKLFSTIFPVKEEKDYFCRVLSTGMCGIQIEKLFILNGNGRNGKGVIDEITMEMLGNYGLDGNITIITDKRKSGANVELSELNKKRLLVLKEAPEDATMNMSTIKEVTGSGKINARTIYSDKTKTRLANTSFLEVNKRLEISSKISNADIDRIVDILFRSTFKSKSKLEILKKQLGEIPEYNYEGNKFYKTKEFTKQYKIVLFHYLQPYFQEVYTNNDWELDVNKPQFIIDRTNEYLQSNDLLYSWFKDMCEEYELIGDNFYKEKVKYDTGCKNDFITLKQILTDFKGTEIYTNLTKIQKRKYTNKGFIEEVMTNEFLKIFYKKRHTFTVDGQRKSIANCLMGYKRISKEDEQNNKDKQNNEDDCDEDDI